jgi:tetratricopeptide (TPR) repeat protein
LANAYSTSREYRKGLIFYEKMLTKDTEDIYPVSIAFINEKLAITIQLLEITQNITERFSYIQAYIQLGIYYEKIQRLQKSKKYVQDAYDRK